MKVDATVLGFQPAEVTDFAERCERIGFDGLWSIEVNHDPFFPLLTAAAATERIALGTGVAVAFPRSPMHLAYTARDLQEIISNVALGLISRFVNGEIAVTEIMPAVERAIVRVTTPEQADRLT